MMNKTLIKPAPTLSSNAPAKGAPKIKKRIDKMTLPSPIDEIIMTKSFVNNTINEVKTNSIDNSKMHHARIDMGYLQKAW
jgi:hypothetical protein